MTILLPSCRPPRSHTETRSLQTQSPCLTSGYTSSLDSASSWLRWVVCLTYPGRSHPSLAHSVNGFLRLRSVSTLVFPAASNSFFSLPKPSFPKFWIESWIYSSAITSVEQCTAWQRLYDPEDIDKMAVCSGNGELLDLARSQLEIVGIELGYLPKEPPFSIALPKRKRRASLAPPNFTISSEDILSILQDRDAFYDIYIRLTNQALSLYAEGGRRKFGLKLHGALAALDL